MKPPKGVISALNCSGAVISGNLISGQSSSGTSVTVSYTNGNGGYYGTESVASTGVLGMTAKLSSGCLLYGNGSLIWNISGLPLSSGTAAFNISVGGQSCTLNLTVNPYIPTTVNIFPPSSNISCNSTYTTSWTVPSEVNSVTIEIWSGGGGGGSRQTNNYSHAGGGGAYCKKTFSVVTGDVLSCIVGGGGCGSPNYYTAAGNGQQTSVSRAGTVLISSNGGQGQYFSSTVSKPGIGSSTVYCLNGCDSQFSGGNGGSSGVSQSKGPGGGGGAGSNGNGGNGGALSAVGAGGTAFSGSLLGGNGGGCGTFANGSPGSNIGGGGGGGASTGGWYTGGEGGDGYIRITY